MLQIEDLKDDELYLIFAYFTIKEKCIYQRVSIRWQLLLKYCLRQQQSVLLVQYSPRMPYEWYNFENDNLKIDNENELNSIKEILAKLPSLKSYDLQC